MKICKKCGKEFPQWGMIDGKRKIFNSRKYCFDCSPYGLHNTRKLDGSKINSKHVHATTCIECGKEFASAHKKGLKCFSCYFNKKKQIRIEKVKEVVGASCSICGYDKVWSNLCFHHVVPDDKKMQLSTRELVGASWENVLAEMKKCVLVCHLCHGEIHSKIIPEETIDKLHKEFWEMRS